ncbi:MAG: caspase family protein, partial [Verrucomicrobia bacterium]|nr:caspase family protein [Verrucomicrobiota bacterium]
MQLTIRRDRHAWLLVGALLCAAAAGNAKPIESGQWFSEEMSTNSMRDVFSFYAVSNDTVIVRVANEDALKLDIPDIDIIYRGLTTNLIASTTNNTIVYDLRLSPITNSGWFDINCDLPLSLYTYSNTVAYSVSILRMPDAPLSYADLDVGIIHSGEYKWGTINAGADLDAATFPVSNRCTVQIRMGQNDVALVPNIQIYDPNGNLVTPDIPPPEYRVEKTVTLTNVGIYTVVGNDYFNAKGQYAVSMIKIGSMPWSTDTDLGLIISGETKTGTINVPGDLDAALFSAVSGDVVRVTMREVDSEVNPVIELFAPNGTNLQTGIDPFQETAVITNTMVTNGVFTVICKDAEDRKQNIRYTLTMEFLPGSPSLFSMPAVPAGLAATDGTYSNRIDITWNAADGANGYDLWRSYETNESVQICTNLATIIYQDENVVTNVTYYYKAKSRNAYGVSTNFSNTDSGYCGTSLTTAMRRALLVGIDNYSPSYGATPLNTCTNDAYGMHDVFLLGDPSNRWASTNLSVLTDSRATKVVIQNALQALATASGAGDLVVYFHSSHGGRDFTDPNPSNTFICTYDANFTDAELAADLALFRTDTKVIIILDTCYSGGMFKLDGSPAVEWLFVERVMEHYHNIQQARFKSLGKTVPKTLGQNIAFMTACDYDEESWTSDYYSLYAGYLITGCALPAVDTDGDGEYSFLELHTYAAAEAVAASTPTTQHAQDYNPTQLQNTIARAVGSNGVVTTHHIYNDFDGDGASDLATFNPSTGHWRIASLKRWMVLAWDNFVWGGPGFKAIDGDYDGDQASDATVYNEQTGEWRIGSLKRGAVIEPSAFFGGPGLTPVSGDYNGDKISDAALYKQPDGYWYIIAASTGTQLVWGTSYTGSGFVPVSGDYDGDRIADLAMFHLKTGYWYIGSLVKAIAIVVARNGNQPGPAPIFPPDNDAFDQRSDIPIAGLEVKHGQ